MLHTLITTLGRLLHRQIYEMPFTRSLNLTASEADVIGQIYQDCVRKRGILMVQPENILSLKLMGIECIINGKEALGRSLLRTQDFFDSNSRDIVDETDATTPMIENANAIVSIIWKHRARIQHTFQERAAPRNARMNAGKTRLTANSRLNSLL